MQSRPGTMTRSDDRSTASAMQRRTGKLLARAIQHVAKTSTMASEPEDLGAVIRAHHPAIIAMWHGQFMMVPALSPPGVPVRTVAARHGDAEILAEALRTFDMSLIRGAGAGNRKGDRGGAHLLKSAVGALKEGFMLPMTADVPPGPARRAGLGIVTLARLSGRPILPFAIATSRYLAFDTWSRMTINLPYSRLGACLGEPIHVPRDATPEALESYRLQVQQGLDAATLKAYQLAKADPLRATPPAARSRMGGPAQPAPDLKLELYRGATSVLRPVAPLILKRREARGKEDPLRHNERLGIASKARPAGPLVWLHAASVGETNTVLPVIHGLSRARPDLAFLLTTGTVTSAKLAESRLPPSTQHQYIPLDAPSYMRRFLEHWQPQLAILTESEIWPNLVLETAARGVPIALINGRMSKRSYRGWRKRRLTALPLFSRIDLVLTQNALLQDWFTDLGAPRVMTTGNLKMDAPAPPIDREASAVLIRAIGDRRVLLAASTHANEEEQLAGLHKTLKLDFPDLLTIMAPRHPERGPALAEQITQLGLNVRRRSTGALPETATDIYLADTIGEMGVLYDLSPLCFMGGSLVPHGGQNPIEAVKLDCGVITGPHTQNFTDTYQALLDNKGARRVQTADELTNVVRTLFQGDEQHSLMRLRAKSVVDEMSGALERSLSALRPLLPAPTVVTRPASAPATSTALSSAASGLQHAD
jgi:3-deoxy-D-manno-octulosonic-acid transferase